MDSSLEQQVRMDRIKTRADSFLQHSGTLRESLGERELESPSTASTNLRGRCILAVAKFGRLALIAKRHASPGRATTGSAERLRKRPRLRYALGEAAIPARFIGRTLDNFKADTPERASPADGQTVRGQLRRAKPSADGVDLFRQTRDWQEPLQRPSCRPSCPSTSGFITCMSLIRQVQTTWRRDSSRARASLADAG